MKTIKYFAAAALLTMITSPSAFAVSADGTGTAHIVGPLEVNNTVGLRFGDIAPNLTSAGTVDIAVGGAKTCASSLTCFSTSPTGAAAFYVIGFADALYDVTVPASVTLNGIGGASGESMSATLVGSKTSGTLTGGSDTFTVGGVLSVGTDQAVGDYSGTFTVTVEYQ